MFGRFLHCKLNLHFINSQVAIMQQVAEEKIKYNKKKK
jgi:hypothetical protein